MLRIDGIQPRIMMLPESQDQDEFTAFFQFSEYTCPRAIFKMRVYFLIIIDVKDFTPGRNMLSSE